MLRSLTLAAFVTSTTAFFFGGNNCGCEPSVPTCPPTPICPPQLPPPCPPPPTCEGQYVQPPIYQPQPIYVPPQPQYQIPPQPIPQPLPLPVPQPIPEPVPQPIPQSYPQSIPQTIPQPLSQPVPQAIPQPLSQPVPQAIPQPNPQPISHPIPLPIPEPPYQQQVNPVQQMLPQGFIENYQNEPIVQPYSPVHNLPGPSQLQEQPSAIPAPVQNEQVVPNPIYQEVPPAAAAVAGSKNAEVEEVEEAVDEKANMEEAKEESAVDKKLTNTEVVAEERVVDIKSLKLTDDPLCNSEDLRKLMAENIDDNLNSSKRLIQLAAEAQFGGRFDVICANGDFSYVTNTELFCQETKEDISCYTYRQI